ncbi:MAG: type II toxin-antitoxin system RelE/ParE family toxin [Hydrococcus sp. RM1_1_31]|nr:type II toxin-antitoxin system RelE/ParE family toxin [Hydrococcus sp. RM1_1_31]
MSYTVIVPKPVQKQLDNLPGSVFPRVIEKIKLLENLPRPQGAVQLKGYKNQYRIRIGNYRVRYEIYDEKLVVILLLCKHRKDAYK